jgi:hypothetical protein
MDVWKKRLVTLTSSSEDPRCCRYHLSDGIRHQPITRLRDFSKFVDIKMRACERVLLDRVRVIETT